MTYDERYKNRSAKATKEPRKGTRVRAVFDYLCKHPNGSSWSGLKTAYDTVEPAYNWRSRQYTGMELSRTLKRYATRVARGVYVLDNAWRHLCVNPDLRFPVPGLGDSKVLAPVVEKTFCTCKKHYWSKSIGDVRKSWPYGYADFDSELHFLEGTPCKQWKHAATGAPDPDAKVDTSSWPFQEGDTVRYRGGYTCFDGRGFKKGDQFKVKFMGEGGKPTSSGYFVYLHDCGDDNDKSSGHGVQYFDKVEEESQKPYDIKKHLSDLVADFRTHYDEFNRTRIEDIRDWDQRLYMLINELEELSDSLDKENK